MNKDYELHKEWREQFLPKLFSLGLPIRIYNALVRCGGCTWDMFRAIYCECERLLTFDEWALQARARKGAISQIRNLGQIGLDDLLVTIDNYLERLKARKRLSSVPQWEYGYA